MTRRILVKVGGELFERPDLVDALIEELAAVRALGVEVVLVHGGGPQITKLMAQFGKKAEFRNGYRYTDDETMELTAMVLLGRINAPFVAKAQSRGVLAIGSHGGEGKLFLVKEFDPALGRVGEIIAVNSSFVELLLKSGRLPVIAPFGVDERGVLFNINADTAAGELASALKVESLIAVTNVKGIYRKFGDESTFLPKLSLLEIAALKKSGAFTEGMLPKTESIECALLNGVSRGYIVGGKIQELLTSILSGNNPGTEIIP